MSRTHLEPRPLRKLIIKTTEALVDAIASTGTSGPPSIRAELEQELLLRADYDWTEEDDVRIGGDIRTISGVNAGVSGDWTEEAKRLGAGEMLYRLRVRVSR